MLRVFFVGVLLASAATQPAAAQSCPANVTVGFRVVVFGSRKTGVWYPSTGPEATYAYTDKLSGSVALNGAPAGCSGLPLVVFSHGFTGCGTQSVFITEQLARNGYIVAAPDHADAACSVDSSGNTQPPGPQQPLSDPSAWTDQTYIDRKIDIQNVIDGMLSSPAFGPMIDRSRIGGMGHSLGGYTILGLTGGWSSWRDSRIKAGLLLSPYCQPFQAQKTLNNIAVPAMYQGGTLDIGITPFVALSGGAYDATGLPKYFADLPAATHFAWSNSVCLQVSTVAQCVSNVSNAALIGNYALAFLNHYVRHEDAPLLRGPGAGLVDYRSATSLYLTIDPAAIHSSSNGESGSIAAMPSPPNSAWIAGSASPWVAVTGGVSGSGNRMVSYSETANNHSLPRTGSIRLAGGTVPFMQSGTDTSPPFDDVPDSHPYADHIRLMKSNAITSGCSATGYCPDSAVTRGQMAVFLIRSMLGDTFPYQAAAYFNDEPATHPYFKYVQKMKELGITSGCTASSYCPDDVVTRGQMAVFVIRGRTGNSFDYSATPYFTDVPSTHPYFNFIQKMRESGVTTGCSAAQYCADAAVTRGQMAVFIIRAFFTP